MVRKLIILAIICLLSLQICTASAQDYGMFFTTPLECAQSFIFCLQQGNLTGALSAFDSRIRADCIDIQACINARGSIQQSQNTILPDEYKDLLYLSYDGLNASYIGTMLQMLLIPDPGVHDSICYRSYFYSSENRTNLNIETYLDYVQKSNLLKVEPLAIYGIDLSKHDNPEGVELYYKNINSRFSKEFRGMVNDYAEIVVALGVDERIYLCGLTLYHYEKGWKINAIGCVYGGMTSYVEMIDKPLEEYISNSSHPEMYCPLWIS